MITITHPEKILFPDSGITKGELAAYYEMIAPVMVPHMRGRPVTMERYHRGIGAPGFFQKDVSKGFPDWLERVEVPKKGGTVHHPIVTDTRSLLWLANQNCITPHVWTSRVPDLYSPDICVFDLDPSEDNPPQLRAATFLLRDLLAELGLPSWLKTSGSKGFHIVVPLDGKSNMGEVASFAHAVGAVLVRRDPENLTQEFHKADRGRPDPRGHRQERIQCDIRRCICCPSQSGRACVGAVQLGRTEERGGGAAKLHAAHDGRAHRNGRRPVGRSAQAPAFAEARDRAAR